MFRRVPLRLSAVAALAILSVTLWILKTKRPPEVVDVPLNLKQALVRVQECGMHWRSDQLDGRIGNRVVVSESPVTFEQANLFCLFNKSRCAGKLALYRKNRDLTPPTECFAVYWGEIILIGSPELIEKLAGVPANQLPRANGVAARAEHWTHNTP